MKFSAYLVAPTCTANQTKIHGVAKQEKASISCQVDANPTEVEFRWTFNNSAESNNVASSQIKRAGTSSTVFYQPISDLDYGTLLCWATNRIGKQQVPCIYHIIAAGKLFINSFIFPNWPWNARYSNEKLVNFLSSPYSFPQRKYKYFMAADLT